MYHKEKRAYATVEATMIMSAVITGIIFIIYVGFYLYDVCVIKQLSYVAALRATQQRDFSRSETEEYTKKQLEELLENRLLAVAEKSQEVKVDIHKVQIEIRAGIKMPVFDFISERLGFWNIKSVEKVTRINPVEIIRKVRGSDDS